MSSKDLKTTGNGTASQTSDATTGTQKSDPVPAPSPSKTAAAQHLRVDVAAVAVPAAAVPRGLSLDILSGNRPDLAPFPDLRASDAQLVESKVMELYIEADLPRQKKQTGEETPGKTSRKIESGDLLFLDARSCPETIHRAIHGGSRCEAGFEDMPRTRPMVLVTNLEVSRARNVSTDADFRAFVTIDRPTSVVYALGKNEDLGKNFDFDVGVLKGNSKASRVISPDTRRNYVMGIKTTDGLANEKFPFASVRDLADLVRPTSGSPVTVSGSMTTTSALGVIGVPIPETSQVDFYHVSVELDCEPLGLRMEVKRDTKTLASYVIHRQIDTSAANRDATRLAAAFGWVGGKVATHTIDINLATRVLNSCVNVDVDHELRRALDTYIGPKTRSVIKADLSDYDRYDMVVSPEFKGFASPLSEFAYRLFDHFRAYEQALREAAVLPPLEVFKFVRQAGDRAILSVSRFLLYRIFSRVCKLAQMDLVDLGSIRVCFIPPRGLNRPMEFPARGRLAAVVEVGYKHIHCVRDARRAAEAPLKRAVNQTS